MIKRHHIKKGAKLGFKLFITSLILVSLVGSYISLRGHKVPVTRTPSQVFENVSFNSQAKDTMQLDGWFFPATSTQGAVIAHGWGGNRETFLDLAEYLQRHGINVLTFDMRGGTGRNTYGQRESGDIAGAVQWLTDSKAFGLKDIVLIGNSIGGAASIDYAVDHPELQGLVLISSVIDLRYTKNFYARDFHLLFPSVYAAGVTFTERILYDVSPTNPINVFDQLTMPTLVLHGVDDPKSPIKVIYTLQQKNKQNVQFVIVVGEGHTFFKDKAREEGFSYSQKITDFINSLND